MEKWEVTVGYDNGDLRKLELIRVNRDVEGYPIYVEKNIGNLSYQYLLQPLNTMLNEIYTIDKYIPAHVVLRGNPVLVSTHIGHHGNSKGHDGRPLVPIMWRVRKPKQINVWHFVHEATEIELKLRGMRRPRWFIEGLSQYTAHTFFSMYHKEWLPYVWKHYNAYESIPISELFDWDYAGLSIRKSTNQGKLSDILQWATGWHSTPRERALYGVALRVFVDRFMNNVEPMELRDIALNRPDGLAWVEAQLRNAHE